MNKKRVFIVIVSLLIFLLLVSTVTTFALIKKYKIYTKEAIKDKYNCLIYEYLKPNRKLLFLEFNTKNTLPVTFSPFHRSFSNRFRYGQDEIFSDFKVSDKTIINKKILYDDELRYDLYFKDGLCFYCFDNNDIKGNKSIYYFDYDEYKRLALFKEQYTYKDEIRDLRIYEYKYVYDYFSKTIFIFIFDRDEIKTVYYMKKNQNIYCISSFTDLRQKNKEPYEYINYCSANLTFENGLITEIYENHYNINGIIDQEYLAKTTYNDGLKTLEELSVKREKDQKYKKIFMTEYQYENRQVTKIVRTNYDEWDRTDKEVSKSTSYNFIYDSNGNEISSAQKFESLKYKGQNREVCVKTMLTYKWFIKFLIIFKNKK